MAHRSIEIVVGRLVTDEEFRASFLKNPHQVLTHLIERGVDLSAAEVAALLATDSGLWGSVADRVDPRLQKASLKI